MARTISQAQSGEVWSATPTPFTESMELDLPSVDRLVEHHVRLGVNGFFLAGTCGEGPWMTQAQRRALVRRVVSRSRGRLKIAVQVTDNSAARILDNIKQAQEDGAQIAVIAPPHFLMLATPRNVSDLYLKAIRNSPIPVGIYDRGNLGSVIVTNDVLKALYQEPNVVMVKDSSVDPTRMRIALKAREQRPGLTLLTGGEFNSTVYLKAGYDGVLLGGGSFNGFMARQIVTAVRGGDLTRAQATEQRMIRLMHAVYGGKKIKCWLSGQKRLMVELGVFSSWKSYLNYPLTAACEKAIVRVAKAYKAELLP
jgi:4-hydroxy-tetrahydrodipicolinate synthase